MGLTQYLPLQQGPAIRKASKSTALVKFEDKSELEKIFKIATLGIGFDGIPKYLSKRSTFESPPQDFDKILQAVDTDSYVRKAMSMYRELFWKEGWEIVGENPEAVDYLYQRIEFMEMVMKRPFEEFMKDVMDQVFMFHNCFVVEERGPLGKFFPSHLRPPTGKEPVIGYSIIPTEKVEILRTKHNKPLWYRQRLDQNLSGASGEMKEPTWNAEEVIHLYRERKQGRAFGTPFMVAGLDDVLSLRQIEEDLLNLIHRELFPLMKYTVGTPEMPPDPAAVKAAAEEIDEMRTDAAMVIPGHHDIDIIGGQSKALDASKYLIHFKERVATCLGVFPHHLGMVANSSANQDMTDRLDIQLLTKVKEYQNFFMEVIRVNFFNRLLLEGGYNPFTNPRAAGESDRCVIRFNEIDKDTQIKTEAHIINKATSGLIDIPEARKELKMKDDLSEEDTLMAMQIRMQPDQPVTEEKKTATGSSQKTTKMVDTTPPAARRDGQQQSSKGGAPNLKNNRKGAANVIRPTNQHGTRTSPNIRHDAPQLPGWLDEAVDLLGDDVINYDHDQTPNAVSQTDPTTET